MNDSTSSSISVSFPPDSNSFPRSGGGESSFISNNEDELQLTWVSLTGAVLCVLLILSTIFGNTLVVIVVAKFHRMRSVTNILLARYELCCMTEQLFSLSWNVSIRSDYEYKFEILLSRTPFMFDLTWHKSCNLRGNLCYLWCLVLCHTVWRSRTSQSPSLWCHFY